jgi:hypothetical protein
MYKVLVRINDSGEAKYRNVSGGVIDKRYEQRVKEVIDVYVKTGAEFGGRMLEEWVLYRFDNDKYDDLMICLYE